MTFDAGMWRQRVVDELNTIADEHWQKTVWFCGGDGKWIDSPDEQINSFYDLAVQDVLSKFEHGLDQHQVSAMLKLSGMMDELCENTPNSIKPADLVDDPRWREIRTQAAIARDALSKLA